MFNRRVEKCCARVEAYGCVDELNAALGVARSHAAGARLAEWLLAAQQELVLVMGELAVAPEDMARYTAGGYKLPDDSILDRLDGVVREIEAASVRFEGWATPGGTPLAAHLDVARTVCRRAERRVVALHREAPVRPLLIRYLNRLADTLWLMARQEETRAGASVPPARV